MRPWKNHRFLVIGLLLPALMWLFFNAASNWHYHQLPCGEIVRHSHPYQASSEEEDPQSPFQSHEHSALGYHLYDQFSRPGTVEAFYQELCFTANLTQVYHCSPAEVLHCIRQDFGKNIFRGPPFLS